MTVPHTEDSSQTGTMGIITLLAALAALGALATNIILPSFPAISASFEIDQRRMALALSSFFLAFAFGQLIVGPLSDSIGRRRVVLGGLVLFVAGSAICAFSTSFPVLIVGRVVQALGAAAAGVLARAIARDLFSGPALTRTLSLVMVAMACAPGFSPLLGTGLAGLVGWRGTFLAVGATGAALAIYYLLSAGETLPQERRRGFSASGILAGYLRLLRNPAYIRPTLAVSFVIGGLYTFFASAPSLLMGQLGLSSLGLALFFAATVFVVFLAGYLAPRLAARFGRARTAMAGILIALAGAAMLFGNAAYPSLLLYSLSVVVFLLGMGLVNPLGTAMALEPFASEAGLASALLGFLQMAAAAVGSSLAGILPLPPAFALALVMTIGTVLSVLLFRPLFDPVPAQMPG